MPTPIGNGSDSARRVAALGPVLWLTFINSVGTGIVTNGIYFLAKSAYGLGTKGNFALGVVLGLTYIAGALASDTPFDKRARQESNL